MGTERQFPQLHQVVLDCTDTRALAEFYRQLLGLEYRPGDEHPDPTSDEWLVLRSSDGHTRIGFQQVTDLTSTTWPDAEIPQQLHLDLTVTTIEDLNAQHERALALGARLLLDRSEDPQEPLRVYADPAGHPFCLFVAG